MTLMAVIFSVVGIVTWIAAGVLLYFRRKSLGKIELMRSVQTSAASDVSATAPGTLVEVKGTLRCENPLKSEMAEQTCAYYLSQVMREYEVTDRDSDGDLRTRRRSEVVASNERFAPFIVEDESGVVGVRGEGAEVDALEVMNRFERDTGGAGSITLGGLTVNLGGGDRTIGYRYLEKILPLDSPVYVLGAAQEDGQVGAPSEEVEGAARFLISYRSEEQLEKKLKRDTLWQGSIAVGLFLFGLLFLAVGVGVAANGFG
jgi:E3 Ubiquitin ligase